MLTVRESLRRWIELPAAQRFVDAARTLVDLVALALAHRTDFIVTGDRDVLEWADQQPPVITPAAFETLLADAD